MKKLLKPLGILACVAVLTVAIAFLLTPWMDRCGATDEEIAAAFPGDELVPNPASFVNRAVTVNAPPEAIYPWIVQLGAGKGGMYSYEILETYLLNCPLVNADRIHEEWQNLKVGDEMKMCPGEFAPPPYIIAQIVPNQAIVMGHQEDGEWVDLWQFVIVLQSDGTSRLITRTRTMMTGGFWTVIHPGVFIMERGMLLGIKERAEGLAASASFQPATPTPEIFNPLNPSPTASNSTLPLTCQVTDLNVYIDEAAGFCFAYPSRFTLGNQPSDKPSVLGPPLGSLAEPVYATLTVEITPYDTSRPFDQQVDEFLRGFSVLDPGSFARTPITVGDEAGILVEQVPVQLSWNIVFVKHGDYLYRLMYWPVDIPEAKADIDELYQVTINTFAFIK
jgi:hypothetical protein